MSQTNWNLAFDYLRKSRAAVWNDDYMEFLIERVWRIDKPVNVVDFGCGIGFLCGFLMPKLPKGSVYTGVDIGGELIDEARRAHAQFGEAAQFIQADLLEWEPQERYDIAICQALLQHIPDGVGMLKKMQDSVLPRGRVICIELDRNINTAALYIDGLDTATFNALGPQQKLMANKLARGESDYCIGLKLPAYMQKIGLKDIGVRMNDFVGFVNPEDNTRDHKRQAEGFNASWGDPGEEAKVTAYLESRGLTGDEASRFYAYSAAVYDYIAQQGDALLATSTMGFIITYGTVGG